MNGRTNQINLTFEKPIWDSGLTHIAGLDEAGRGALAGPVAVGAVILPPTQDLSQNLEGVRDSKQMTHHQREVWAERIKSLALAWSVEFASSEEIDLLGIVPATKLAAERALYTLSINPDHLLLDYRLDLPDCELPQTMLVRGDQLSLSISAASVLAKTTRDTFMYQLDVKHPGYDLGKHKGYGTQAHRSAMLRIGYSPVHRKTFSLKQI